MAGSRLASGAHARRVERRQVVVVLNPVGAAPECPDGRVDDEARRDRDWSVPLASTTGRCAGCAAVSRRGSARRRRSLGGRRWVRSRFPFLVTFPDTTNVVSLGSGVCSSRKRSSLAGDASVVDVAARNRCRIGCPESESCRRCRAAVGSHPREISSSSASMSSRSMSLRMRSASLTMRRVAGVSPYFDANDVTQRRRPPISSWSSANSVLLDNLTSLG